MELASLDLNSSYTYADYLKWNFKERVELIKGKLFKMSPAPGRMHQEISGFLYVAIYDHLRGRKCKVYAAPFDVRLPGKSKNDIEVITVVQPDICVVCDETKLDSKGCIGAPDIVVEILSPSNNVVELKNKYDVYERAGVTEYWIISPQDRTFLVYTLSAGAYTPSRLMVAGDSFTSGVLPQLTISMSELFDCIN
jgi:Uma2 family endonuclease